MVDNRLERIRQRPVGGGDDVLVLIVDDDETFRATTSRSLQRHGYGCLEASSAAEARTVLLAHEQVAAVLCGIRIPGSSGSELLDELTTDFPGVAVIMTTGLDEPATADADFEAGAFGYLVKPFRLNELLIILAGALRRRDQADQQRRRMDELERTIAERAMSVAIADRPHDDELAIPPGELAPVLRQLPPTEGRVGADLTRRELEVLDLIVRGLPNKEIAQELGLRLNTVRNHVQNILYKLQAHSKLEAVAAAVRENVISYPTS